MTKPSKDSEILVKRDENGRLLPGSILNPAGKAPGTKHITTKLWEALQEVSKDKHGELDPEGKSWADKFVERLLIETIGKGNPTLMKEVLDRIDGKIDQGVRLEVTNDQAHTEENVMEIARRVSEELKKKKTE